MLASVLRSTFVPAIALLALGVRMAHAQAGAGEIDAVVIAAQQPVSLLVNGFPLYDSDPVPSGSVTYEINAYLTQNTNSFRLVLPRVDLSAPGTNTLVRLRVETQPDTTNETDLLFLERVLGRGTTPADAPPLFESILITNAASSRQQLDCLVPTNRLTRGQWDADAASIQHALIAASAPTNDEFVLTSVIPGALLSSLPWEGTPPVLTVADKDSIRTLVTNLCNAIRTNDDTTICGLLLSKVQRFAQARATTDQVISNALITGFTRLRTATPPFTFDAIDPQALEFVTYPATALVEAKINGGPPIHAVSATNEFSKRVFLSRISGEWRIVD